MGDPKCVHICAYFCFAKLFSLFFLGILCFRKFFSLSLFPSLFPLLLLVHLSSVTNSLLLYFSRSSCPFLTRSTPSACLSLSLCLWPCFCRHLFWFFSLSLSIPSFIFSYAKAKTRQKPIQQETPPRSRPQRLRNKQGRATP